MVFRGATAYSGMCSRRYWIFLFRRSAPGVDAVGPSRWRIHHWHCTKRYRHGSHWHRLRLRSDDTCKQRLRHRYVMEMHGDWTIRQRLAQRWLWWLIMGFCSIRDLSWRWGSDRMQWCVEYLGELYCSVRKHLLQKRIPLELILLILFFINVLKLQ